MTDVNLEKIAADAKAAMKQANPANAGRTVAERKRIPMTAPLRKLEVDALPGYHLQWIRGDAGRIAQAQRAGFEFVQESEVTLNSVGLGNSSDSSGNTDMGGRVSVTEGSDVSADGQPVRLYLMKQLMEHYLEDQAINQARTDSVAQALTASYSRGNVGGAAPGETQADAQQRYVDPKRSKIPDLFRRKS